MSYTPNASRYSGQMQYRRTGNSGLALPLISLGLWQNFGGVNVFENCRAVLRHAFDNGITHFDLANNYGPPAGSAEENFGRWLAKEMQGYRDELIISTKAGWNMWDGPYGGPTGSRKHLIASCDQSLRRMGLDYVDIFYSHRVDPDTPLEETMGALAQIYRQGKALYVGISSYSPELTRKAAAILEDEKVPLFIHQPNYSMFNRSIEGGLLDALQEIGAGCIAFSPMAQGLLTNKYLNGIPDDARVNRESRIGPMLNEENLAKIRALNEIAGRRGQTLAQMAVAWALRDARVTSALVGARTVEQLSDTLKALDNLAFSSEELKEIDRYATEGGVDLWRVSSQIK
ncbi:glyceraldehyde 3-phosphate reductase [Salmonella enterica subsp. enterica serovar Choleraesuis]|nr:glyceraldehyde 3-phosphate reductase [Salmonella enterica subsp. enterica serovar Choleraesuis]